MTSLAGRDLVTLPRDGRFRHREVPIASEGISQLLSSRGRWLHVSVPTEGSASRGRYATRSRFLPFDSSRYKSSGLAQGRNDVCYPLYPKFQIRFRNVPAPPGLLARRSHLLAKAGRSRRFSLVLSLQRERTTKNAGMSANRTGPASPLDERQHSAIHPTS